MPCVSRCVWLARGTAKSSLGRADQFPRKTWWKRGLKKSRLYFQVLEGALLWSAHKASHTQSAAGGCPGQRQLRPPWRMGTPNDHRHPGPSAPLDHTLCAPSTSSPAQPECVQIVLLTFPRYTRQLPVSGDDSHHTKLRPFPFSAGTSFYCCSWFLPASYGGEAYINTVSP